MTVKKKTGKAQGGGIPPAEALRLEALVDYAEGAVVSRTVAKGPAGTLTLFAFDQGQELSEHSAPYDAYVTMLDGEALLRIGGSDVRPATGETVLMPANVPHSVQAPRPFKMLLTMLRNPEPGT